MPEGDTIHYAANRIRPVLAGHVPDELRTPHPRFARARWEERLAGRAVTAVDAHGKHLFLRFEGGLTIHSHLRMTGSWRVLDGGRRCSRAAWLLLRRGERTVVQLNGPVLELMTESRTRFDQRLSRLGPGHPRAGARRGALPAPPARGRPDARRSATPCSTSARSPGSATCGRRRAASRPAIDPWRPAGEVSDAEALAIVAGVPPAHAALGARRQPGPLPAHLRRAGRPCPRCGPASPIRRARPGRRQPHDLLVPVMSDVTLRRVGHKGADHIAPGNTTASFDAALAAARRHDRVRRPARATTTPRARPARSSRTTTSTCRPDALDARGGARAPRVTRASPTSSSTSTSSSPATSTASSRRCASTGSSSARSSRRSSCAASSSCASSSRGCGSAGRCRA